MCDIITITHVFGCDSCHHFACATSVDKPAVYFVVSYVCVDELVSPDNHCTVQTRCRPVYVLEHSCWYPVQSNTGCDKTSSPNENNKLKSWSSSLAKGDRRRRHHHHRHHDLLSSSAYILHRNDYIHTPQAGETKTVSSRKAGFYHHRLNDSKKHRHSLITLQSTESHHEARNVSHLRSKHTKG